MADSRRLFVDALPALGGELELPPESARHARVLRLAPGARVELFDGRAGEADAVVSRVARERVSCQAGPRHELPPPRTALHILLGLPKGKKLEDATRMLTELGVASIGAVLCERSVPEPRAEQRRLARLQRIALEACAQSGQPRAPELRAPRSLLEAAAEAEPRALRLVFYERASEPLRAAWPSAAPAQVFAIIGPEGGLSPGEVEALSALGFVAVGLGRPRLRFETAAPVIAGLLLERLGRLE